MGRIRPRRSTLRVLAQALALGHGPGQRTRIEVDLLAEAGTHVVFGGRGRTRRRSEAARRMESLDRALTQQVERFAAQHAGTEYGDRAEAMLDRNRDNPMSSHRDHML